MSWANERGVKVFLIKPCKESLNFLHPVFQQELQVRVSERILVLQFSPCLGGDRCQAVRVKREVIGKISGRADARGECQATGQKVLPVIQGLSSRVLLKMGGISHHSRTCSPPRRAGSLASGPSHFCNEPTVVLAADTERHDDDSQTGRSPARGRSSRLQNALGTEALQLLMLRRGAYLLGSAWATNALASLKS